MMTMFNKIWAVKTDTLVADDATIEVKLKNGGTKSVKLEKFLYSKTRADGSQSHYYLPAAKEEA